jgi:type 1 glutamine amidotransferase
MTTQRLTMPMRRPWTTATPALLLGALTLALIGTPPRCASAADEGAGSSRTLRALLITGGCCHDYERQKAILSEGISARAKVEWTIVHEGGTTNTHRVSVYEKPDWAKGYDVILHNECFAQVTDPAFIENVLAAHRNGTAAVVIHCTMHTFRDLKSDEWREFLGVTTRRHGPQQPLDVKNLAPNDPIMKDFPLEWKTGKEELYAIEKVWPGTEVLAQAYALDNKRDHAVIWKHTYGKGRVFGTTLAHNNTTMSDPVYLDMLTRGFLWSCDQLDGEGKPTPAYRVGASASSGK